MRRNIRTKFNQRQYMISKDFEIYYYSDTHMQNVTAHVHDYYEFYFFLKGNVSLSVGEDSRVLQPGDILVIPPNTRHKLTVNDPEIPYQRFIFWMKEEYCNYLGSLSEDYTYLIRSVAETHKYIYHPDTFAFQALSAGIVDLLEEIHTRRFARTARISLCVQNIVLTLNRCIYEMEEPQAEGERRDLSRNVLDYIENNLTEGVSLDLLAEKLCASKYYISHIFKENMGISVHQYLLKKRLDACRNAILSGTEISIACEQYGFNDYSGFFRAFRKEYGVSPKEYLRMHSVNDG